MFKFFIDIRSSLIITFVSLWLSVVDRIKSYLSDAQKDK